MKRTNISNLEPDIATERLLKLIGGANLSDFKDVTSKPYNSKKFKVAAKKVRELEKN